MSFINKKDDKLKANNLNISLTKPEPKKGFSFGKIKSDTSFVERIKSISKRDFAFFLVGISILILAPVAQYFFSKPDTTQRLTPGFGERRSSDSVSLYEPGVNALSAGSPDGLEEVVTPLTAKDPASLIIGLQSQETRPPLPPVSNETKRDSVADIAKKSFSEAVKSSPAPFIPPKLAATLRGASSFFGDGGGARIYGNVSSGKIIAEAKSAPSTSQKRSMIGPQAIPGYKGVATQTDSVNKGAFEKLRNQADKAAGYFSGADARESLSRALDASVNPSQSGGFGALNEGRNTQPSGSSIRGSSSYSPGDPCRGSLAQQLACENARKANDFRNFLKYDLQKQLIQSAIDNLIVKGLIAPTGEKIANSIKSLLNPQPPSPSATKYCWITKTRKIEVIINKDNNGSVQLVPNVNISDCPCGYLTKEPYPECTSSPNTPPAATNPPSSNNQPGGSSNQASTNPSSPSSQPQSTQPQDKDGLSDYDALLIKAIESANKGMEAKVVKDLKENTSIINESLIAASSILQKITQANISRIDAKSYKKVSEYKSLIDDAKSKIGDFKNDYDKFKKELNQFDLDSFKKKLVKAINDYQSGKFKPKFEEKEGVGAGAETLGGEQKNIKDIIYVLNKAKEDVEYIENENKAIEYKSNELQKMIKSHDVAYMWYVNQINISKKTSQGVYEESMEAAKLIDGYKNQVAQIPDNASDGVNINALRSVFKDLTGKDTSIALPQNPPGEKILDDRKTFSSAGSYSMRMSVASSQGIIDRYLLWRSADIDEAWKGKINDKKALEEEANRFDGVKPSLRLGKGEVVESYEGIGLEKSFLLSLKRADEVEKDVDEAKQLASNILDGLDGLKTALGVSKGKFEEITKNYALILILNQLSPQQNEQPKPEPKPKPKPKPTKPKPKPTQTGGAQGPTIINQITIINQNNNTQVQTQTIKKK